MDLNEIRGKIDALDNEMLKLFIERMGLALDVAEYKAENDMPVFQRDREKVIIKEIKEKSPEELKKSAACFFINII